MDNYAVDELDPRDGPTKQFLQHHDVTNRAGGKRVFPKLEQLLRGNYIEPEHCEAGRRFTRAYLKGQIGRGRSCLDIVSRGSGDGHPSPDRLEAFTELREAIQALIDANSPAMHGKTAADLLIACCVEELPWSTIATRAGVSDEVVKSWAAQALTVLAGHYARVDRISGRSTTQYTKEQALKRFDPEFKT